MRSLGDWLPYATSVPLYLMTWPKWLHVLLLAVTSTMLTLFYLGPLRKKLALHFWITEKIEINS